MATHPDAIPFTPDELDTVLRALEMFEASAQYEVNTYGATPARRALLDRAHAAEERAVRLIRFAANSR